jgi:hypothetical protein
MNLRHPAAAVDVGAGSSATMLLELVLWSLSWPPCVSLLMLTLLVLLMPDPLSPLLVLRMSASRLLLCASAKALPWLGDPKCSRQDSSTSEPFKGSLAYEETPVFVVTRVT